MRTVPGLQDELCLDIVGPCYQFDDGSTIDEQIAKYGLQKVVNLHGFVSRSQSLIWQARADLLLLLVGHVAAKDVWVYGLAAKAFDYTMAKKPVLCISTPGPTASYIKESGIDDVYDYSDQEGVVTATSRAISGKTEYNRREDVVLAHDFNQLVGKLAALLFSVSGQFKR